MKAKRGMKAIAHKGSSQWLHPKRCPGHTCERRQCAVGITTGTPLGRQTRKLRLGTEILILGKVLSTGAADTPKKD